MQNLATLLLVPVVSLASAGDPPEWGGFRGNNGAGLAASETIPDALDPETNRMWRTEVPPGYSSPTVAGERVFVTAVDGKTLLTLCLDRATGEARWTNEVEFDGRRPGANSPAAPSPTTDGERVYVLFDGYGLVVYDVEGEELWDKPMGPFNIPHGISSSPLAHDGKVVLLVDQDLDAYLIAFDAESGEELWKTERRGVVQGYSSPVLYTPAEGEAQVVVSGSFQIAGYSLASGEKLWWVDGGAWQAKCVPVIAGEHCYVNSHMVSTGEIGMPRFTQTFDELLAERDADGDGLVARDEWDHPGLQQAWFIFDLNDDGKLDAGDWDYAVASGRSTGGLFAIRLGGEGDVTESHVDWLYDGRKGLPHIPSPIVVGDALFTVKEGAILTAFDLGTGEALKSERIGEPDTYYASPISAAGKIITASQSGHLSVIRAGKDWEVVSTHPLDEEVWSTPAIAGDQVFVRTLEAIHCFGPAAAEPAEEG
ncbi:MAG: PQQ-binding-like beta-propeller repeat protein [Planctomycetota bacterium]